MRISELKKDRISEQILAFLYSIYPKLIFTSHIAMEIVRDEEFVKSLLLSLKKKGLIIEVKKNPKGIPYSKRARWTLSDSAYEKYKKYQQHQNN